MKKIGLIGGMSWESSLVYYQLLNQRVRELLGGYHSARCILDSVDFAEIEKLQHDDDWPSLDAKMSESAVHLEKAGAEVIVLCTNTMHLCADAIVKNINIPFLHIADVTGQAIMKENLKKVLLLGTKFTMEKGFYSSFLLEKFGIDVMVPDNVDRDLVHEVIYSELVHGNINPNSRAAYERIILDGAKKGAEGVILGCTEIPLLISPDSMEIPIFDTTKIHAYAAVDFALD